MDPQAPSPVRPLVDEQRAKPKSSKYTPIKARKALLRACIKTKSGSREVLVKAMVVSEVVQLLSDLEAENATLSRRLKEEQEAKKTEVLDILRDMRLPLLPFPKDDATEAAIVLGRNMERQAANDYCRQKAYEYDRQGIGPDPTEPGQWDTLPKAEPATLPCQGDCQTCEAKARHSMTDEDSEIIGRWETTGWPVYEGDDYVLDAEGCYLTRAEADELAQEAAAGSGVGLQGEGAESSIVARVTFPKDAPPLTPELGAALTEMIQLAHKQVSQPDGTTK